ncbi:MAG: glutamate 5-kinase [Oscillospiraceae bacterium]|nr:glutamate 5-kinase [Oscillospiraceae bacterium]
MKEFKRIVVKVGTSTLTHESGKLNLRRVEMLTRVLSDLMNQGLEIVLVTSGAIGVGVGKMGLSERPTEVPQKQAMAAVGQGQLMSIYDKFFSEYSQTCAQVLLTRDVLDDEDRRNNAINAFSTMFEYGIIPIVNENDVISTFEINFGDNDTLSAYVARLVSADLLIILSDIDGLYDKNPKENPDAMVIPVVYEITDKITSLAGDTSGKFGTGGMVTKIKAAEIATKYGINMIIANGSKLDELYDIFDGKSVGTLFTA